MIGSAVKAKTSDRFKILFMFVAGHAFNFEKGFEGTSPQIGKFAFAFYNGLFSYDGW